MKLADKYCKDIATGTKPLNSSQINAFQSELSKWKITKESKSISKLFEFNKYLEGIGFANKVGNIAEKENHHPDITITWRKVNVELSTHSVNGLSENDFILAAKIDEI